MVTIENYTPPASTSMPTLPAVSDPDVAYSNLLKDQYAYFQQNFAPLERELIDRAMTDTTLIDQAREDSQKNSRLTSGMMQRASSR